MVEGRKLEQLGDHPRAVQAFERAVAARPADAAALSELGWAAFQVGDLVLAALATERAVAATQDARLKAASLYNLGRIQEQRGEKAKAAESYQQSLALRPNPDVRTRLHALAPPARAAPGPLVPRELDGPFPSVAAWCTSWKKSPSPPVECFLDPEEQTMLARPASPWLAAKMLQSGRFDSRWLLVAVQTPAGWFVTRPAGDRLFVIMPSEITLHDVVPGGFPELWARHIEMSSTTDNPDALRWVQHCTEKLVICGLGAGNRPSCTPPVAVREGGCEDPSKVEWEWELDVRFLSDGQLKIAPKQGTPPASAKALIGTHTLVFR